MTTCSSRIGKLDKMNDCVSIIDDLVQSCCQLFFFYLRRLVYCIWVGDFYRQQWLACIVPLSRQSTRLQKFKIALGEGHRWTFLLISNLIYFCSHFLVEFQIRLRQVIELPCFPWSINHCVWVFWSSLMLFSHQLLFSDLLTVYLLYRVFQNALL